MISEKITNIYAKKIEGNASQQPRLISLKPIRLNYDKKEVDKRFELWLKDGFVLEFEKMVLGRSTIKLIKRAERNEKTGLRRTMRKWQERRRHG